VHINELTVGLDLVNESILVPEQFRNMLFQKHQRGDDGIVLVQVQNRVGDLIDLTFTEEEDVILHVETVVVIDQIRVVVSELVQTQVAWHIEQMLIDDDETFETNRDEVSPVFLFIRIRLQLGKTGEGHLVFVDEEFAVLLFEELGDFYFKDY
jgi:hypothetical protein